MEDKKWKVFEEHLTIRQCQDPGDPIVWGVFFGDRLIGSHKTKRAARYALADAQELRCAICEILFSED